MDIDFEATQRIIHMLTRPGTPRKDYCTSDEAAIELRDAILEQAPRSVLYKVDAFADGNMLYYWGFMKQHLKLPQSSREGASYLALSALAGAFSARVDVADPVEAAKSHEAVRDYLGRHGFLYYKGREPDETGYVGYNTSNRNGVILIGRAYAE